MSGALVAFALTVAAGGFAAAPGQSLSVYDGVGRWHAEDRASFRVGRAELRFAGSRPEDLVADVVIDGEVRPLDYADLIRVSEWARAELLAGRAPTDADWLARVSPTNRDTFAWALARTEGEGFALAPETAQRMAGAYTFVADSCLSRSAAAAAGWSTWLTCTAATAATAGGGIAPCIVIGIGAYFMTLSAADACVPEIPCLNCGPGDRDLPPCSDATSGYCLCACPGQPCCSWPDP